MGRKTSPLVMALVSGAVLALSLAGCVDNYGAFYISQAMSAESGCVPPQPIVGGGGSASMLTSGLLDVSIKKGYQVFLQIENHMQSTTSTAAVELNLVSLREFNVNLELGNIPVPNVSENQVKFSEGVAGTILPNNGIVAGLSPIGDALAGSLATVKFGSEQPTIIAKVRATGVLNGSDIETPEFRFPIKICSGCLVDRRDTCPTGTETFLSNTCGLPQDSPVTCCPTTQPGGIMCMKGTSTSTSGT